MRPVEEVLRLLSASRSSDDVAETLHRLLRLPDLWAAVGEPGVTERCLTATDGPLSPDVVLLAACGYTRFEDLPTLNPEPDAAPPVSGAPPGDKTDPSLKGVLTCCAHLMTAGSTPSSLLGDLLNRPEDWRTAVACAWPHLDPAGRWLETLASSGDTGLSLAATALATNVGELEAGRQLSDALGDRAAQAAVFLWANGEPIVARALASHIDEFQPEGGIQESLAASALARLLDKPDAALEAAQKAWNAAQQAVASSADALAEAADADGDSLTAVEARRQAVRAFSTPARRATLAVVLAGQGEPTQANEILSTGADEATDHLARGIVLSLQGDSEKALAEWSSGWSGAASLTGLAPSFVRALLAAVDGSGQAALGLDISAAIVDTNPSDPSLRRLHAERLLSAGDAASAVEQAKLAQALEPDSAEGRRILARALQADGRPSDALNALGADAGTDSRSMAAAASYALEAGQADRALAWSLRLLDASPASSEAKTLHARALALGGGSPNAVRELQSLTEENPGDDRAWIALAEILDSSGETARAGETLQRAIQSAPGSPALQMALGRWYAAQSRWSEAEQSMRPACASAEASADWHYDHGRVLDALGWPDACASAYEHSVRQAPGHWPARIALAESLESQGRLDEASRWMDGIPLEAPAGAHFAAGRLLLRRDSTPAAARKAAGHLLRAQSLGEGGPELHWWMGQAFEAAGDNDRAVERYGRSADEAASGSALRRRASMAKGRAALAAGQPASAVAAFEQLRQEYGSDAEVQVWLARACLAAGLETEALPIARAAADMDPTSNEALAQWAETARRAGARDEALSAARRLTERTPEEGRPWLTLAELLLETGDNAQAREATARAVAVGRKDVAILRPSADLLARLEDLPAAERLLDSVVQLRPDDPQAWIALGEIQDRSGRLDAACDAWVHAASLPSAPEGTVRRAAAALAKAGRDDESLSFLKQAHESAPGDPGLLLDLAEAHMERGERNEAKALLESLPSASQITAALQSRAGLLLSRVGMQQEGLTLARAATDLDPTSPALWTALAEVCLRSSLTPEAVAALDRAVRLPNCPLTAYALLVHAHLAGGETSLAWDGLRAAASHKPASLEEARAVAAAHLRMGEWQAALNTIEEFAGPHQSPTLPEMAEILLRMCDASWLYGDVAGAPRHAPAFSRDDLVQRSRLALPSESKTDPRRRLLAARAEAWALPGDEALTNLQDAAEAAGNPASAWETLAIAYMRADKPKEAFQAVQKLAANPLEGVWRPLLAGLCHQRLGNVDLARQAWEAASNDPGLLPLARAFAARLPETDDGSQVIAALNDAVAAWPNEPGWHLVLANHYLARAAVDSALPHLQHAADLDPDNGDAWLALARALRDAGHPQEAQEAYEQVVRLLPGLGQVWKEAGSMALARADFSRAATWFARAQAVSPADLEALIGAARADLGMGRRRTARQKAEAALDQTPESPLALECLADVLAAEGDVNGALALLDRAAKGTERPATIVSARARLLMDHGRSEQAVADLQQALEADGDEALWAALADGLAALGRFDDALKAGGEAARIAPRNPSHRIRLGRISREAGHLDRALDELTQAEALASPSADLAMEQGRVFEERREFEHALEAYQRAVELDPGMAKAYLRAGLVYRGLKAYPQAARMFKRAVELSPDDASALHQLAAVHALQLVHGGFHPSAVTT